MTMVFGVLRAHQIARSPRGVCCLQVPPPSFSTLAEDALAFWSSEMSAVVSNGEFRQQRD